jgi:hypothetical protein
MLELVFKKRAVIISLSILCLWSTAFAQSAKSPEYMLKSAFLEKFTQFTDWPENSELSDISQPFVISVIGENPFKGSLKQMSQTRKIKNRKVEIRYISSTKEISPCHILFVSASKKDQVPAILLAVKNKPILTVSEFKGFAEKGGHINFYFTKKGTLHFEINEAMVRASGLRMHLLLIEIAKIVK